MYATKISSSASIQANQPIGLDDEPMINSNNNVILNEEKTGLLIINPGLYKARIQANFFTIVASSSTGNAGVVLYINGEEVAETDVTISFSESTASELVVEYPINVVRSEADSHVLVQFYSKFDATLRSGYVTIERVA